MRNRRSRIASIGVLLAALVVALVVGVSSASGASNGKLERGRHDAAVWNSMSDSQKQAVVDRTHAMYAQFVKDFVAQHRDPRSLSVVEFDVDYWAPSPTLASARQIAARIAHTMVRSVTFQSSPSGNLLPEAIATVEIIESIKGSPATTVTVIQEGGPMWNSDGKGRLAELSIDPLLLPQQEAVLLLTDAGNGLYRTMPLVGVNLVKNNVIAVQESAAGSEIAAAINGKTVTAALATLRG